MLVWENPEEIGKWIEAHGGGHLAPGAFTALGWVKEGKLKAGLGFYNFNGAHCLVNIAIEDGIFPPALLKAALFYVFKQLTLRRVTFIISSSNMRSQNLVVRLGAKREATLREADMNGDLFIYALFPEDCYIWSRIRGKEPRSAAES